MRARTIVSDPSRSVTLRPVIADDQQFLLRVYASTRAEELAAVPWAQQQKDVFVEMQFHLQREGYAQQFPGADHSIILLDDSPAGRIMVDRTRASEIRGVDIAILPEYRKLGVGSYLIANLLDEARTAGLPFRIQVEKFNSAAIRLYEGMAFVKTGESFTHIAMEWFYDQQRSALSCKYSEPEPSAVAPGRSQLLSETRWRD